MAGISLRPTSLTSPRCTPTDEVDDDDGQHQGNHWRQTLDCITSSINVAADGEVLEGFFSLQHLEVHSDELK